MFCVKLCGEEKGRRDKHPKLFSNRAKEAVDTAVTSLALTPDSGHGLRLERTELEQKGRRGRWLVTDIVGRVPVNVEQNKARCPNNVQTDTTRLAAQQKNSCISQSNISGKA